MSCRIHPVRRQFNCSVAQHASRSRLRHFTCLPFICRRPIDGRKDIVSPRAASDPIIGLAPRRSAVYLTLTWLLALGPSMEISRARGMLVGGQSVPQSVVADRGVAVRQKMLHPRRSIRTLSAKSPDGRQIRTLPSIRIVAESCPTEDIAALSPRPRTPLASDKKNPNPSMPGVETTIQELAGP